MKSNRKPKTRKLSPAKAWGMVSILVLVGIALTVKIPHSEKRAAAVISSADLRVQLSMNCKTYMEACKYRDNWWLTETLQPGPALLQKMDTALEKVRKAMATSASASPLAKEISVSFPSFFVTQFLNGNSMAVKQGQIQLSDIEDSFEICFIPEDGYRNNRGEHPTSLYYRGDWNAVMMGGVSWPETFFSGVLMHELGHAYQRKDGSKLKNFSQAWFEEEVTMHELEAKVFDLHTQNQYSQKASGIVEKYGSVPDIKEFVISVPTSELLELDTIVGIRDKGQDVRGVACTQHFMTLGFAYIDSKKGSMDDKVAFYRWFVGK